MEISKYFHCLWTVWYNEKSDRNDENSLSKSVEIFLICNILYEIIEGGCWPCKKIAFFYIEFQLNYRYI